MKLHGLTCLLLVIFQHAEARLLKPQLTGMYLQWGYNRDWYSKSDIHFSDGASYDFTIHGATAKDRPNFDNVITDPLDITIPQNNYRIGFYLNKSHTHAIEINFDHAKYVMENNKRRRLSGHIGSEYFDTDTVIRPEFIRFEHTDGANFYHINYVGQSRLWEHGQMHTTVVYKAGAGIVVPRTEVVVMEQHINNRFHVAGYVASVEAGLRFYLVRNLFVEATGKAGFANYLNSLTIGQGSARHHFWYAEIIGLVGYDINFHKKAKKPTPATAN